MRLGIRMFLGVVIHQGRNFLHRLIPSLDIIAAVVNVIVLHHEDLSIGSLVCKNRGTRVTSIFLGEASIPFWAEDAKQPVGVTVHHFQGVGTVLSPAGDNCFSIDGKILGEILGNMLSSGA